MKFGLIGQIPNLSAASVFLQINGNIFYQFLILKKDVTLKKKK